MDTALAANGVSQQIPRGRRYGLGTSIRYRVGGEHVWREGTIVNISVSGVLLVAHKALEVNTPIEMRFVLPIELKGESAAELLYRGVIVRCSPAQVSGDEVKVAAKFLSSRFLRQSGRK
jgi:hypothetical protein